MKGEFSIRGRPIGPGHPTYVIAEMSGNHNGAYAKAAAIVRAAKKAGADAVKLQTYTADTLTIDADNEHFRIQEGTLWDGQTLHQLYGKAYTPWPWQPKLKRLAGKLGIDLFSSPFDASAVDFLAKMGVPAYKIASFELVDLPLIRRVAKEGKPIIMSTGMATEAEIREAVTAARAAGAKEIALLRCTSAYPAAPEEMDLHTIPAMAKTFQLPIGLSDHTMGSAVAVAGVALGACIVEKHLTLSRGDPGPDSAFSMEPAEFREMVRQIRIVERALGGVRYGTTPHEKASLVFRRSLFVVEDVRAGEPFTSRNVRSIRPGYGLHTRHYEEVLGRRAARPVKRGTPLSWDLVSSKAAKTLTTRRARRSR